jgi:hypothetical protein
VHYNSHLREVCEGNLFRNHRFGKRENQGTLGHRVFDGQLFLLLLVFAFSPAGWVFGEEWEGWHAGNLGGTRFWDEQESRLAVAISSRVGMSPFSPNLISNHEFRWVYSRIWFI